MWRLSLLHSFIQQSQNSGSAQVQVLPAACQRFAMVKISDNAKRLSSVNHTTKTIHHHQKDSYIFTINYYKYRHISIIKYGECFDIAQEHSRIQKNFLLNCLLAKDIGKEILICIYGLLFLIVVSIETFCRIETFPTTRKDL